MEPEEVPISKQDNFEMEKENNSPDKKEEITPLKEKESISESSPKEEDKLILGKKVKRETKKINRELCSICRDGGNLLLCDYCPRSFHIECLKLKEENIPEGKWYCPMCAPKMQKRLEKNQSAGNEPEDKEKERKRLIKNQKRRLWRLKKKEQLEAIKNSQQNNVILVNKQGNTLIDSFLKDNINIGNKGNSNGSYLNYINKMDKLPFLNSKICINITYSALNEEEHPNKNLSLPLLFPIPNDVLINSQKKLSSLNEALNKVSSIQKFIKEEKENKTDNDENANNNELKDIIINKDIDLNNMMIDEDIETKKLLQTHNSVNALNSIIKDNKDIIKYNILLRDYWDVILQKKSSAIYNNKQVIKYPIDDKELYSFPDLYGLDEKYFSKKDGIMYPYFNGALFTRLINVYDFLLTFSSKLYLSKFSLEELYAALKLSETHKDSEIILLSSIHISLIYLLFSDFSNLQLIDIYNNNDIETLILKIIVDNNQNDIKNLYSFIYLSWPELIRLIFYSYTFNINHYMSDDIKTNINKKLGNVKDVLAYNTMLSFEDKLNILESLILLCYETSFIRDAIKEAQEDRNEIKKSEKEMEEDLKEIESKKREYERQEQFTQPQAKIEEINKRLSTLSEDNSTLSRQEITKLRKSLEHEKNEFKAVIRKLTMVNNQRDDILNKIEKKKIEIFDIPMVGKKCIGYDGRGYKYYYFPWIYNKFFVRINSKDQTEGKYEWHVIEKEENIKDIIDKLSEKGIHESALKKKMSSILHKRMGYRFNKYKNEENNNIDLSNPPKIEDIFNNNVLKYENIKNPLRYQKNSKINTITTKTNQFEIIYDKLCNIESIITNYLSHDGKQWESFINRSNIIAWITCANNIKQYVNFLLFLNDRVKNPYKIEEGNLTSIGIKNKPNKKIIEDDIESNNISIENNANENIDNIIDNEGKLVINYVNKELQFGNKIRLWSKEFESYNLEDIYLEYLNSVNSIPMLHICIDMFEIVLNDLSKRREYFKKRNDDFVYDNKIIGNNSNEKKKELNVLLEDFDDDSSYNEGVKTRLRKNLQKNKKKTIDWNDKCMFCGEYGDLMCCEDCPNVAHLECTNLDKMPETWRCEDCLFKLSNRRMTRNSYAKPY
jgi:hypothetical protein